MIDDLKPYPEYRASGVPWMGSIPANWEVRRNGRLFAQRNETGFPELPILEVSLRTGVRVRDFASSNRKQVIAEKAKYKRACRGDLAYNMMRMWQGAVGVAPVEGLISPAYIVARPLPETEPRYFSQLFCTGAYKDVVNVYSRGIVSDRNRLYWEDFKQIPTPFPPPDEQAAIVRFLDHANGKIERAIRAKRKLIALLNEQKQAIIYRAVTRGLDPNVKLKPSGIPWLGDVPEHWEVRPLKQMLTRMDYGTSENARGEGRIRVLGMGHIRDGRITLPTKGGLTAVPTGLLLERHDLLFNRTNSPDLVGKVGLFEGVASDEVTFASYLVRLRLKAGYDPCWLNYLLNSFRFWGYARSQALVSLHQANLNSKRYGQMAIPVPPRNEQPLIVELIHAQGGSVEAAITRTDREIALLREYRTRLTADVVTGKLDVREAVKRLPAEAEEPLPVEEPDSSVEEDATEEDF